MRFCCNGVRSSFNGIFSANFSAYVFVLLDISLDGVFCVGFFLANLLVVFISDFWDGFYAVFGVISFEMEVLFGVSGFVVNVCDDLTIWFFNGSSLKLCSMASFILGCKFWNKWCKLLMLPCGHFQNIFIQVSFLWFNNFFCVFHLWFYTDFQLIMLRLTSDVTPSASMLHQLLRTISLLGRWSPSGSDRGIAHFFTATRNTIEGAGEKRTNEQYAWVIQAQEGSYVTLHFLCA